MNQDEQLLWRLDDVECVMISCCSGAELQVRSLRGAHDILLRELYPTKSDLYERSRELRSAHEARMRG